MRNTDGACLTVPDRTNGQALSHVLSRSCSRSGSAPTTWTWSSSGLAPRHVPPFPGYARLDDQGGGVRGRAAHDPQLLGVADRVLELGDGVVVEE
ncbi:hypothetical protein [Streptomyces sp. NPDC050416]|uniref:hypothetical protein n=1 Tax=Streptomyces sp. NPDC050416 TaxID=3365611 RepID=UPI0037BB3FA8